MEAANVNPELIRRFPSIAKVAEDLKRVMAEYQAMSYPPIQRGGMDFRALSWRCKALATANLLRGEELLRFALQAINEGALITAHVLIRALDETLAVVVGSLRKIDKAIASGDEKRLSETLIRLTCGNRYMAEKDERYPKSYNILDMIDETGAYLNSLISAGQASSEWSFRDEYELVSEMVHPFQGSFSMYQRFKEGCAKFDRAQAVTGPMIEGLLTHLRMSSFVLLRNAERLAAMPDLPTTWPATSTPTQDSPQ